MLSYIIAHWQLIMLCGLTVVALGFTAFFLKNWKIAVAAVAILCFGLAYQSANLDGYNRAVAEAVKAKTIVLEQRLTLLNEIADDYEAMQLRDTAKIQELESSASETPKNDTPSLDAAAAGRIGRVR